MRRLDDVKVFAFVFAFSLLGVFAFAVAVLLCHFMFGTSIRTLFGVRLPGASWCPMTMKEALLSEGRPPGAEPMKRSRQDAE